MILLFQAIVLIFFTSAIDIKIESQDPQFGMHSSGNACVLHSSREHWSCSSRFSIHESISFKCLAQFAVVFTETVKERLHHIIK